MRVRNDGPAATRADRLLVTARDAAPGPAREVSRQVCNGVEAERISRGGRGKAETPASLLHPRDTKLCFPSRFPLPAFPLNSQLSALSSQLNQEFGRATPRSAIYSPTRHLAIRP